MQRTLEDFLRALRGMEVRVSVAESIEAHQTAALVGYDRRRVLKDALAVTLAKSEQEKERYDRCFELFFARDELRAPTPEEDGQQTSEAVPDQGAEERLPDSSLARMILADDRTALTAAMAAAANRAEIARIPFFTQRGLYMRRTLEEMGLRGLEQDAAALARRGTPADLARAAALERGRQLLLEDARDLVERQIALYANPAGEQLRQQFLENARFGNISPGDFARVRHVIRRLARKLATRHSRRRLAAQRGKLDVRHTLRANLAHGGMLFRLAWKHTRVQRPRVVVLCDVSGSVAAAAEFLLLFLYSLNEVLAQLRAFAFSSHLVEVTEILEQQDWDRAVPAVLDKIGFRPTDYGRTLQDLRAGYLDTIDRHTTLVVLGDGRNNRGNPRTEVLRLLRERARRVIWLNPEPRGFWGTGDSEMLRYAPYCHLARTCNTIKQLERFVDDLLKVGGGSAGR